MKNIISLFFKYKVTIFVFIFYTYLSHYYWNGVSLGSLLNALTNSILILLLFNTIAKLICIRNILFKYLGYIIMTLTFILLIIDVLFIFKFKSPITGAVFASIVETNTTEIQSVMKDYWIVLILLIVIITSINYFSIKELNILKLNIRLSLFLIVFLFVMLPFYRITISTNFFDKKNSSYLHYKRISNGQPLQVISNITTYTYPVLYNDFLIIASYIDERFKIKKFNSSKKILPKGISKVQDRLDMPDKIYLVIGESSYRNHYSLYGYFINTTPFLDSLKNYNNNTFNFYNAISPASITRDAIRMSLTFSSPNDRDSFFSKKSIIDLARDEGYQTIWLSNQEKSGLSDNYVSLIAASSDIKNYFTDDVINNKPDDLNLINQLKLVHVPRKKQFIALHMRGSHGAYQDGYDQHDILDNEQTNSVEYDKTIHHTDRFLKLLHNFIKETNDDAILYYYSDHGELINLGHGVNTKGREQYEIPLLVINYNNKINTDSIISKYIDDKTQLINSLSTINILAEFIGYHFDNETINQNKQEGRYILNPNNETRFFTDIEPLLTE